MRPVVALLTDFGVRDHYVATMKGVILGICREAALVDITHEIPPQDVVAGALELHACYRYFPTGTIFLAVVDPGVGSTRRPIAAAAGDYRWVAPDNGLLAPIFDEVRPSRVVRITRTRDASSAVSRTFEGRDRFAPAAAWLAAGEAVDALGEVVEDWTPLALPRPFVGENEVVGEVVRVDRFGNLVTNIRAPLAEELQTRSGAQVVGEIGGRRLPLVATYADVPAGGACALTGSTGHIEVSVNGGSAAERLGAGRGARVRMAPANVE